jgi:ribonuclease HI
MKVFTDGACSCNGMKGSRGSWAAVFPDHPELDCSGLLEGSEQTNNRAEFTAAIKALEATPEDLEILTDSNLLVNVAMGVWRAKANMDLVARLKALMTGRVVTWTHVRAHTKATDYNSKWNREADKRAVGVLERNLV